MISTRKHFSKYAYLLKRVRRTDIAFELVAKEPHRGLFCLLQGYRAYGTLMVKSSYSKFCCGCPAHKAGQAYTFQSK